MTISDYKIMSGECDQGYLEDFTGTYRQALKKLEEESCGGDRWASLWVKTEENGMDYFVTWLCVKALGCHHEGEYRNLI